MSTAEKTPGRSRRRAVRDILIFGLGGGVLIALLKLTEYRFLVVEHSLEIYGGLVAVLFSGLGIWLGLTLTRKKAGQDLDQQASMLAGSPFSADEKSMNELGITPRELEILGLIAAGLSNRENRGAVVCKRKHAEDALEPTRPWRSQDRVRWRAGIGERRRLGRLWKREKGRNCRRSELAGKKWSLARGARRIFGWS
jgi:hypothetical protein